MKLFFLFKLYCFTLVATFLVFAAPVCAQAASSSTDSEIEHKFSIGAIGLALPKFEGSDSYKFKALPLLEYSNQYFFISVLKGAGVNIIHTPTVQAGPLLAYRMGRKEKDSERLDGMGNVKGGAEAGAFFNWQFHERLGAEVKALHGLGEAKGYIAEVGLTFNQPIITDDLSFALRTSARFADSDYNQQFFGVTKNQSRRSGYESYSPVSGIKHVSAMPMLSYSFLEHYKVDLFYEYKRLTGPAADSPLVKKGSANQNAVGVSLSWNY